MGCCASRKATAVGTVDEAPHKEQSGDHTGQKVGIANIDNGDSATKVKSEANAVEQNTNFTITPKYRPTAGVNSTIPPSQNRDREPETTRKLGPVFPSTNGYMNQSGTRDPVTSVDLLVPGQTSDVSSSNYANTDHLRASPYLSGMGNRKQYNRTELDTDTFRGFDAPVTNSDSEDGFDSDIEKEEKTPDISGLRAHSPADVSLSSILNDKSPRNGARGENED